MPSNASMYVKRSSQNFHFLRVLRPRLVLENVGSELRPVEGVCAILIS